MEFFMLGDPAAAQRQQMQVEEATHRLHRLLDELEAEQLEIFRQVVSGIATAPDAKAAAFLWTGLAIGAQARRFDICTACGKDHMAELTGEPATAEPSDLPHVDHPDHGFEDGSVD